MDAPFKLYMAILVITVAAAVALGGVKQSGDIQTSTLEATETKAQSLLD